ncbi:MAG: hypothetical protein GX864_02145 [Mollicutes bacterium]|nr:hypothetical protein [Mollicutes bacterium]
MAIESILPADTYTVINRTVLTDLDRKNLTNLYGPIIGSLAISLYLTLWCDLDKNEIMSIDYTHHHLMTMLKCDLDLIKVSREALEAFGLIRTYLKTGEVNSYVYELYSPLPPYEFFNHPIFNVVLYNNVGKKEYDLLKSYYKKNNFELEGYEDITSSINKTYKTTNSNIFTNQEIKKSEVLGINLEETIDFDLIISSLPKGLLSERALGKKTRELINSLAFIYDLDTLKMVELLRKVINEHGLIDREELRKETRKYYQYSNQGNLPTLIYRTQPEYLKTPSGDTSNRGKILYVFENTSPYDFLRNKYKGSSPTARDLRLLEMLAVDLNLKPAVINVLIDYVLKSNDNKLTQGYVETIAGQWKRLGIETANEAMEVAEKQHKKYTKISKPKKEEKVPIWFDKDLESIEMTTEEETELENLLKDFR